MHAEPRNEHQWLKKLIGTWTYEADCQMGPDQPPAKCAGSETVRCLGDLWVLCEGEGEMPGGGPATTLMSLGYDPARKRFVGTWIGSMMPHLWVYDGELNAAGTALALYAEGPSFAAEGKLAKYKDVLEIKSDDRRVLISHLLGEDGQWQAFVTANYRRRK